MRVTLERSASCKVLWLRKIDVWHSLIHMKVIQLIFFAEATITPKTFLSELQISSAEGGTLILHYTQKPTERKKSTQVFLKHV